MCVCVCVYIRVCFFYRKNQYSILEAIIPSHQKGWGGVLYDVSLCCDREGEEGTDTSAQVTISAVLV